MTGLDANYIKDTIGPDGQLTHCFAALSHDDSDLPADAFLSGKQHSLEWKKAEPYSLAQEQEKIGYQKSDASGLPVLESRILYALSEDAETYSQLEELAQAGEEYKGLPAFVVDLRHNGGGDSYYARSFVEGFAGQAPQLKVAYFEKCSDPYVCEFFLPHSGLFLRMGSKISFYDYVGLSEGVGVRPDLWVNPADALDAVIRLCDYYSLNQTIADTEKQ